jgi:hypothetical protein
LAVKMNNEKLEGKIFHTLCLGRNPSSARRLRSGRAVPLGSADIDSPKDVLHGPRVQDVQGPQPLVIAIGAGRHQDFHAEPDPSRKVMTYTLPPMVTRWAIFFNFGHLFS